MIDTKCLISTRIGIEVAIIGYQLALYPLVFLFNPLSPHDALKHHFTSQKKGLIFLQIRALELKFP